MGRRKVAFAAHLTGRMASSHGLPEPHPAWRGRHQNNIRVPGTRCGLNHRPRCGNGRRVGAGTSLIEPGTGLASSHYDARGVHMLIVRRQPGEGDGSRSEERTGAVRLRPCGCRISDMSGRRYRGVRWIQFVRLPYCYAFQGAVGVANHQRWPSGSRASYSRWAYGMSSGALAICAPAARARS